MCWNMFWREVKIKKSDLFITTTQSEKWQGCKKKIRLSEALGEGKSEAVVPRTEVRWQHRVTSLSQDSTMWSWHATGWVSVKWVTFCLGLHVRGSSRQAFGSILFKNLFGFGALAGILIVVATTSTWSYHFIWSKYLVQRFGHSSHSSWEVSGTGISSLPFLMISSLSWTKWPAPVLKTQPNMIFFYFMICFFKRFWSLSQFTLVFRLKMHVNSWPNKIHPFRL